MKNQNLAKKLSFSSLILILSLSLLLSACEVDQPDGDNDSKIPDRFDGKDSSGNGDGSDLTEETSQKFIKFNSKQELLSFIENANSNQDFGFGANEFAKFGADDGVAAFAESAPAVARAGGGLAFAQDSAAEFSETNVQVQGVDEADIVKNDGKYIYTLTRNSVFIVDAFPAEDAEKVSEITFDGNPTNMFIKEDRLVVFTNGNDRQFKFNINSLFPHYNYKPTTHVIIFDIKDRSDPEVIKDYTINGNYFQARMIDDIIYVIAKDYVNFYGREIDLPVILDDSKVIARPEIFYFDNPEYNYVFHTIASFDVSGDQIDSKTLMMGHSNTMMMSKDNIYITYQKNIPYRYQNRERFFESILPLFPKDVRDEINEIDTDDSLSYSDKWNKIDEVLEDYFSELDEKEIEKFQKDLNEAIEEYAIKQSVERAKTIIHSISVDEGEIEYNSKGEVSGTLLNQFSLDEHDGNLRVATTTNIWTGRDRTMYNNVFVLNSELEVIGELEDIAPDERIYSTRFIGDRLYMVTFKNIDPFFVIDLSDPKDPEILGELKIPGFSDYLHPYDETHIIGIGKETEANEWGGVSTGGVKLALFDVSNVNNPKEVDKFEIGKSGTDSEALRDHKAFLFDRKKNLLVIPVREVEDRFKDPTYGYFRNRIWQGAYVFHLDESGFEERGRITHVENKDDTRSYYWRTPETVRRSLFMDNILYTVSETKIKMNDLNSDLDELNEIDFNINEDMGIVHYSGSGGVVEIMDAVEE